MIRARHIASMRCLTLRIRLCVKYSDVCSLRNDLINFFRQQTNELQPPGCFEIWKLERALSDELFLLRDNPRHVEIIRRLRAVGILSNNYVTLFRAQHVHGLRPISGKVIGTSECPQSFPNMTSMSPLDVDLEGQLS